MSAQHLIKNSLRSKGGFTLLELMITVSIIAVLSAVGITTFSQSQKLARDSKRKQDIRSISIALELYYQANKNYPNNGTSGWYSSITGGNPWIPQLTSNFIKSLPKETKPSASDCSVASATCFNYSYFSGDFCGSGNGNSFFIGARLENDKDPDTGKPVPWKGGSGAYCTWLDSSSASLPGLFAITN